MTEPDPIEVLRKAYELSQSHGHNAHGYAAKRAAEASANGETEEHRFWKGVADALEVRSERQID